MRNWFLRWRTAGTGGRLEAIARQILYGLLFLFPLFFLPFTLDPLELNKQTLLVLGTLAAFLCWFMAMISAQRITLKRGAVLFIPAILLSAVCLSASVSLGSYLSFFGPVSQGYTSVLSFIAYTLLFYLVVHLIRTPDDMRRAIASLLGSAALVAVLGACSVFGVAVFPFAFATDGFNTVGTLNALGIYLAIMCVIGCGLWVVPQGMTLMRSGWKGRLERIALLTLFIASFAIFIALDYWTVWVLLLAGLGVLFSLVFLRPSAFNQNRFLFPFLLAIVAFLYWAILPSPLQTRVYTEVVLGHESSAEIARQSLASTSWAWGSGPGTYVFQYARYHGAEVNETIFWDTRFDRASSWILTLIPTLGLVGAFAWLLLVVATVIGGFQSILNKKSPEEWYGTAVVLAAFITLAGGLGLYSANATLLILFFTLAALVWAHATTGEWTWTLTSKRVGLVSSFSFLVCAVVLVSLLFMTSQRYLADVTFAKAVEADRSGKPVSDVIRLLDQATRFNRWDDIYYRNLGQALLLQLADETADIDVAEELSIQKQQYIEALTGSSIDAVVRATALSPNNVQNWLMRGSVYRELAPIVDGASALAVDAFEHAVTLEPNQPQTHTELGKSYLVSAEEERELMAAEDKTAAAEAEVRLGEWLAKAEAAFHRAIELKADYAPAHYQLAVTFEQQGRLDDAIGKLESIGQYNTNDVGVAFQLGLLYLRRDNEGDIARAQTQLERAVELAPSYSNAHWYLASIYEQQGDLVRATQEVARVLELNPGNDLVASRLERLQAGLATTQLPPTIEAGDQTATNPTP